MTEASLQGLEAEMLPVLVMAYPKAFFPLGRSCRPLRVGIFQDLDAVLPPKIDRPELRLYLGIYTRQARYLRELTVGAARIDLNGRHAGWVSAKEAASAAARLDEVHCNSDTRSLAPERSLSAATRLIAWPGAAVPRPNALQPAAAPYVPNSRLVLSNNSTARTAPQKVIVVLKRKRPSSGRACQDSRELARPRARER
jgi:sRNA-binding protein